MILFSSLINITTDLVNFLDYQIPIIQLLNWKLITFCGR